MMACWLLILVCMCIFSFLKGAHLVFVIMEKSRASCFSGPHCTQPAAACGMSLRPAGCLSSPCVEFGRQPMPVMRGRGWWFGKQKARCDWEGKQLAFWGASDKLSGREAPTAARSQGGSTPSEGPVHRPSGYGFTHPRACVELLTKVPYSPSENKY